MFVCVCVCERKTSSTQQKIFICKNEQCIFRYMYPVRPLTSEGDRVSMVGLSDSDAANFDLVSVARMTFMLMEMRTCEDYWRSNILVVDLKNYSLAHVPKFTLPLIRKFEIVLMVSIYIFFGFGGLGVT